MARKGFEDSEYIISTAKISEIFGYDPRRIQQLTHEGALVRVGHGKFDLRKSIQAYIEYKVGKETPDEDEIDNAKETAKWTKARREKAELEVAIIRGELHRSKDVERVMNDMLGAFRARLLSLPTKMAPQVIGKTDLAEVKDVLKLAVIEAMNELSNYDPNVFYDYSTDKMFLEDEEEELEMEVPVNGTKKKKE